MKEKLQELIKNSYAPYSNVHFAKMLLLELQYVLKEMQSTMLLVMETKIFGLYTYLQI